VKLILYLIVLVLILIQVSCKNDANKIDIYFVDESNDEISTGTFETRPFIFWKPSYNELEDGSYELESMEVTDIHYNWFTVKVIIANESDHDFVLNNVENEIIFFGQYGNTSSTDSISVNNGCNFLEEESCQFCYPRTIASNTQETLQVNGRESGYRCRFYSADSDTHYTSARVTFEIEVISEVYGRLLKTVTLFATPKTDFSGSSSKYGWLWCSDGEHYSGCGGYWEWDGIDDLPGDECNCDSGGCNCEDT